MILSAFKDFCNSIRRGIGSNWQGARPVLGVSATCRPFFGPLAGPAASPSSGRVPATSQDQTCIIFLVRPFGASAMASGVLCWRSQTCRPCQASPATRWD